MKISVIFISIAILFLALNFNLPLVKDKKQHYITTYTGVPVENTLNQEADNVSPTGTTGLDLPVLSNSGLGKKESYILPTKEQILVIGINAGENNEVTFNIKDELPKQRQAYLEYDLFGFEDFTCVCHSINDLVSMGGKIIRLRNEWTHQAEKIDASVLKQGNNIIRFHIPKQAHYRYKVKNVRIRFAEKINNGRQIIVNLPSDASHYGEYFYLNGYIQTNDTVSYSLFANEKPVYVFDNHFDEIISFTNQDNPEVELKAVFNDGYVCSAKVNFGENKQYHFISNESWVVPVYRGVIEPLSVNKFNFNGISLFTEEKTVKEKKNLTIMGLRNEDMPLLDAGLVNVTANYRGFRCLPHGILFDKSVEFRLSYDSTLIPKGYGPDDIRTFFYNEKKNKWEMLEFVRIDKENKQVISKTNHFTDFINGILKTPELPQTMAYTPTSMKDMKYADPVAHVNIMSAPSANSSGTANVSYPIDVPAGRQGLQPNLSVNYSSDNNIGIPGNGWNIPIQKISIDTRWGVPRYSTTKETEEYLLNGEQLVELSIENGDTERLPLVHMAPYRNRHNSISGETHYAYRVEGAFHSIIRHGTSPVNYWWEVVDKNGTTYYYGKYHTDSGVNNDCVVKNPINGGIAQWTLSEVRDLYDNFIKYEYGIQTDTMFYSTDMIHFFYPRKITYTGHSSSPGAYSVEFVAPDSYSPASGQFSARYGFRQAERAPIQQILVKYNNDFVKGYYFKYKTGAYNKGLLCSIVEYTDTAAPALINSKDCDELETDYIHGAKAHVFQYYEEEGISFQTPVSILSSPEPQENMLGVLLDPTIQTLGRSRTFTKGAGGSICFGFDPNITSKSNSVGANFSYSWGPLVDKVQFMDMNGDGLTDKLVKDGSNYKVFYGQLNSSHNLYFSTNSYVIDGLSNFGRTKNNTWTTGLEAQWKQFFVSTTREWRNQITDRYFIDVNADGYPDFVDENKVRFNTGSQFVSSNDSILLFPDDSCYSTNYSGSIDSVFIVNNDEDVKTFSFRRDPVKMWISPGKYRIDIISKIKRNEILSKNNLIYYSIQLNDDIIDSGQINFNDTNWHTYHNLLSTEKGDYLFFRLHATQPLGIDEVIWDPEIIIEDTHVSTKNDADEKNISRFQYSKDAVVHDKQSFVAPYKGNILLTGQISSPAQSDTLRFIVKHNQTFLIDTIYPDNQSFSRQFNYDMPVDEGDSILFKLLSSCSNVNWSDIDFTSQILYYQADSLPNLTAADSMSFNIPLQMSIFSKTDLLSSPKYLTAGSYTVYPSLYYSNSTVNDTITYTIKSKRNIIAKKKIVVQNSVIQGTQLQNSINFTITQPDTLFGDFFTTNPNSGNYVDSAFIVNSNTLEKIKSGYYSCFPDSMHKFGNLYRQWGQFSYFSHDTLLIDLSKLVISHFIPDTNGLNNTDFDAIDSTYTFDDINNLFGNFSNCQIGDMPFSIMMANNKENRWDDFLKSAQISPTVMTTKDGYAITNYTPVNNFTFDEDFPDPDFDVVPFSNLSYNPIIIKQNRLTTNTYAFSTTLSGSSLAPTVSTTKSKGMVDYMDMNGDRYPDIVGMENIQYSTHQGGLSHNVYNFSSSDYITLGQGYNVGVSYGIKSMRTEKVSSKDSSTITIDGLGIGNSYSHSSSNYVYVDINGDGLPDRVDKDNNEVKYNLGYDFTSSVSMTIPTYMSSSSASSSLSSSALFNYNKKHYSWAGGVNGSINIALDKASFFDINNDGLLDICQKDNSNIIVYINTGTGFNSTPITINTDFSNKFLSTYYSANIGASVAGTMGFTFFSGKIVGSAYFDISYNLSTVQSRIMDLNGDNTLDYVYIENNEIKVKYGIPKKVNLLKKVITPLKSSYTVNYEVSYPTAQSPSSRWVMSSLKTYDGFVGDGVDTLYYTFTYDNPYYHRMERDFFGFETVTTKQTNNNGNIYRIYVDKYRNEHYLFKGLKKYELIEDGASNKYIETYYTYDYKDIPTGNILNPDQISCSCVAYPAISQEDKYYYEGESSYGIHTQKTYRHGPYGNIKQYVDLGNTDYPDDDVRAEIYYDYNLTYNLTGMVSEIEVRDYQNNLLLDKKGYYNSMGKLEKIVQMLDANTAAAIKMTYDTIGNITKIEYPEDVYNLRNQYSYVYDSITYTYPAKITDFWGNVSRTLYDLRWGLPLEQTDISGNKIQFGYYNDGKLKYVTGPYEINTNHHTIDCEYWDEVSNTTNFWARTWHFDPMDTTNRMLTVNFADGLKRNIQSKRKANVNGIDKFIVSGRVYFDNFGRVVENYLPLTETFGEDSVFHSGNNTYYSTLYYDILDRPTKQMLPDNTVYNYDYKIYSDFFGNRCFAKVITDPNNNTTIECTDAMGRKTTVNAPLSTTTAFVYDPLGQLRMSRDPEDNYTFYQYDMLGRMTQRSHPDAGITRFTYDLAGNILTKETQKLIDNSEMINYNYDSLRLVEIEYPENPEMNVYYQYGAPGSGNQTNRLIRQQDASGMQTFTYGKLGELIQNVHTFVVPGGYPYTFFTSWDYDTWGRTKSITYPDGETVYYGYDHGGNLVSMYSKKGIDIYYFINDIKYNEFGKRTKMYYNNGVETKFEYNPANQRLATLDCSMGDVIQHFEYSYDDIGNITRIENTSDFIDFLGGKFSYSFNYDGLYRLSYSEGSFSPYNQNPIGYKNTMEYTASGNIYRKSLSATTLINGNLKNIDYDRYYQYNSRPHTISTINSEIDFTWDANGNMTYKEWDGGLRSLCWDEENRLSAVSDQAEETQLSVYLYDANGERAWKFSGTTNLLLINGQILSQQTALNKTLYVNPYMVITEDNYTKHYFIESERIATKLGSGFGAAAVMPGDTSLAFIVNDAHHLSEHLYDYCKRQITCVEHPGNFHISPHLEPAYNNTNAIEKFQYFYHTDHLGSSSFITNASGNAEQHLLYMPFGELFVSQTVNGYDSRYKFTGKERDTETNLDYFGARYYTSDESIWLSVDGLSDKYPSLSPYMYCAGNPVRLIDPDGNASIIPPTAEEYAKFNISPETQKRFDAILHNIESFKNNETFMNAFTNTTGLTTEQATEFLTYGKGPKVDLVSGNWANSTDYINKGYFTFGVDMINYLGSISSENIDQMGEQAFGIAMVLTDELSHCGDMKTNKSANSTGNNFNNPGKQNWKFSPTLHRGDDARFFSFGIGAMTNTEHAGDPGKVSYYIPSIKYQPSSMPIIPNPIKRENRIKIGNQLLK